MNTRLHTDKYDDKDRKRSVTHGTPPLNGVCNFLMSGRNARVSGLGRAMTEGMGNWVGGRFELDDISFRFSMNRLNKMFQASAEPVVILRSDVRKASKGKMFMFFSTVDLDTDYGQFRIRSTPKSTRALLAAFESS